MSAAAIRPRLIAIAVALIALAATLPPLGALADSPPPEGTRQQAVVSVFLPIGLRGAVPSAPATPSEYLIDAAEAAGTITREQALTYRVFALFGDSRLPAQFRSSAVIEDSQAMAHLRAQWQTLSPEAQAAMAPYLLPPNAPGSWHDLATAQAGIGAQAVEWRSVDASSGVKVWYQPRHAGDEAKAIGVAAAIDGRINTVLTAVMDRSWLPDDGLPNNGGDGRLDIYLVRGVNYRGLATPYSGCHTTPAWINVLSTRPLGDETNAGIIQTVAHEMKHAVQFAFPLKDACSTYDWLAEATAKWFEHHVYPLAQSEQPYAPAYLSTAYWPLENTANGRHYGAYLYPFFVAETQGSPASVSAMWQNAGTMDSLKAVGESGAGFATYWQDFVLANWNRGPATEYQTWDSLTHAIQPHGPDLVPASGPTVTKQSVPATLEHLSATYYRFRFTDLVVRSVIFYNGVTFDLSEQADRLYPDDRILKGDILPPEQIEGISVQALIKIEGEDWRVEDWTTDMSAGFCRDAAAERLEELVLIFANGQHDKDKPSYTFTPTGHGPALVYSDVGCWQWKGTITATSLDPYYQHHVIYITDIVLQRRDDEMGTSTLYDVRSGSGTINYRWRNDDIEQWGYTDGPQSFTLTQGNSNSGEFVTNNLLVAGPRLRAYHTSGVSTSADYPTHWFYADNESPPYDHPGREEVGLIFRLPNRNDPNVRQFEDGGVMQGSYTVNEVRYDYNLTAQRE